MLPYPSQLFIKGTPDEQIRAMINYLEQLVQALNRAIDTNKSAAQTQVTVRDIGITNGKLAITYTDDSIKYINLGE